VCPGRAVPYSTSWILVKTRRRVEELEAELRDVHRELALRVEQEAALKVHFAG